VHIDVYMTVDIYTFMFVYLYMHTQRLLFSTNG